MLRLGAVLSFSAAIVGRVLLAVRAAYVLVSMAVLVGFCTAAPSAYAQTAADLERGRVLFREGLALEAAGDWKEALGKFEAVARIRLTPQVRFHIARTKEYLGRLTEALGDYRMAEYEATQTQAQELPLISQARSALQQRIPRLVIEQGAGGGLQRLTLDGVDLGQNQLGLELAVDPGRHTVVASWVSGAKLEQAVDSREGEITRVLIRPPESSASPVVEQRVPAPRPAPERISPRARQFWPVILGSVGVAGIATGAGLFYLREEARTQLDDACVPDRSSCPESLRGTYDRGQMFSWLAPVVGGVGVVTVGAAGTWGLLSEPPREKKPVSARTRLNLRSSTGGLGVELAGSF
jgi:hypothetical protein